ncbi:hypothetical protein BGZ83_009007 [Gryganskiella cystojenkinii]|nr:hypothetical protein BGZ83_009007 [Gryganskiella cystojenkinii]
MANRSPSPDTGSTRCKAIAASTGQRCSRSGKLDGYCSEKHKQQQNGFFGMHANPAANPFTDSENEDHTASKATKAKKTAASGSKTTKALKALGVKKSSTLDSDEDDPTPADTTPAPVAAIPTPASTAPAKAKKAPSPTSPAAAKKKTAAPKKTAGRKITEESSDDFIDNESDEDYEPTDSDPNYSDYQEDEESNDNDEEDDLEELTSTLASVKIKNDDPTLPPRPVGSAAKAKPKIFNMNKILAPPKNKTTSNAAGKPSGFWVPAPAPVKIPESTLRILASVRDKLKLEGSASSNDDSRHQLSGDKKSSGLFNYKAQIHKFMNPEKEELDPESKHANVRKIAHSINAFFHKFKKPSDSDLRTSYHDHKQNQPLPALPSSEEKKNDASSSGGRRDSTESVESVIKNVQAMSIKSNDSQDEFPNQCQGFNTNGHRCKRKVKLDRPVAKGEVLLCHDHEVDDDDEVVVHIEGKGGVLLQWLDVAAWVNPNLPDYVQNKLRKAMERPVSDTDKPGYIYAYHLLETRQTDTHTLFKVGRTDNVFRRMNEWSDKCGSPPRLIEVFPEQGSLAPHDDNDLSETASNGAGDNDVTGLRCRYSHRVERLIHIELKPFHDKDHVCECKTNHREWFKVPHQPGLKDSQQIKQSWEQIRRVIVHWMSYMEKVYGPG